MFAFIDEDIETKETYGYLSITCFGIAVVGLLIFCLYTQLTRLVNIVRQLRNQSVSKEITVTTEVQQAKRPEEPDILMGPYEENTVSYDQSLPHIAY